MARRKNQSKAPMWLFLLVIGGIITLWNQASSPPSVAVASRPGASSALPSSATPTQPPASSPAYRPPAAIPDPTPTQPIEPEVSLAAFPGADRQIGFTPPQGLIRYVSATSLNVRANPSTTGERITSVSHGERLEVLETKGDWVSVRTPAGRQGWVHGDYLATSPPPAPRPPVQAALPAAGFNRADVIQQIIAQSQRGYSGNCPCPDNRMSNGRRCGGNSAYSRPGGARPLCYASDVTDAMISAFVARR